MEDMYVGLENQNAINVVLQIFVNSIKNRNKILLINRVNSSFILIDIFSIL